MNYIILDLEWNQSTNGSDSELLFEIIEIGAVKYDENFKKLGTYQKLIKPTVNKRIHSITTNITGITESILSHEKPFKYVMSEFLRWCGEDYILCTFGNQDILELQRNMEFHNMNIPWRFPLKYIDVQRVFDAEHPEINEIKSLEALVNFYNIKQKNVYHRALGDALYTAEVMKKLDREGLNQYMSLDYYNLPEKSSEEKEIDLGTHTEFVSRLYNDKEELVNNRKIYITRCRICNRKCRKKIKWFADNTKHLCLSYCEEHGMIEGNLVIRKKNKNEESYYAVRRVKMVDEVGEKYVRDRKKAVLEKRRNRRQNQKDKNNSEN